MILYVKGHVEAYSWTVDAGLCRLASGSELRGGRDAQGRPAREGDFLPLPVSPTTGTLSWHL